MISPNFSFRIFSVIMIALGGSFSALAQNDATLGEKGFAIGINGHPFNQPVYLEIGLQKQIELLKQAHATIYRVDLPRKPAWNKVDELIEELGKNQITPLFIIFPPGDRSKTLSPAETEAQAYAYASDLVHRYKGRVHYWEMSNELDNFSIHRNGDVMPDGTIYHGEPPNGGLKDYDETRYQSALGTLRGLSRAFREGDPTARLIVNTAGWVHVGFIAKLIQDKLDFDILSWHWYSEDGNIQSVQGKPLLQWLQSFNKPIWITEGGFRPSKGPDGDKRQADYLSSTLDQYSQIYPSIRVYCVYELLDEPTFSNYGEAHYGLFHVEKSPSGRWELGPPKPAFNVLCNFEP